MSDHNQDDDKKLKDAAQDVADGSVTSFDDLEDENANHGDSETPQQNDELLSFAEEEAGHKLNSDDDFDLPDFDNSFAGQDDDQMASQGAEIADDLVQDTAGEYSSPVDDGFDELEDDFDLDFGSEDIALATEQAEPKAVEVIVNPTFDPVKQQAKDPFPLPDDLAPAEEVYSEPVPSLEATSDTSDSSLDLEMDLTEAEKADLAVETPDVSLEVAEEVVAAHEEDLLADEDEDNFGAPLTAPEMETLSEPEGGAASEVMAAQSAGFDGLDLDIADDDLDDMEMEELPDLSAGSFSQNLTEDELEAKFFKETISLGVDDLYSNVLKILYEADDLSLDATAKARVGQALKLSKLPQLVCRDLVIQKIITPVQLSRAIARTQKRKEITSFLNIPHEAMGLRQSLDSRVCALLREARAIPLWHKVASEDDSKTVSELHLAHEAPTKNLVLEASISEFLPDHKFVWHFALRDVCGAFWLSGEDEDVDSNMEADALLDRIIGNAIDARSSDIHIDPSIKGDFKAMVRYRVDGFVQSKEVITLDQLERLRVRIENIARMPKVDRHHPNKGAFTRSGYDWRIQIQPHAGRQGPLPRIVIRRLNPDVMAMEQLGYPEYFIQFVREAAKSPNGVILWTGPTGSGKTESIHSAIVSANPMGRGLSVHTIEDPPEKRVAGYAVQMEMAEADPARSGLELLKSSLRADPDVVVFGEVRDPQMAGLVFEAANTGHLVFSTLHTNTSLDAIIRLDELGIYGFNISYVRGIAAQRLIRRLCTHCKQPVNEIDEYTKYVFNKFDVEPDGSKLFTHDPNGCASCNYTGYHGRIAIAEWLSPNKEMVNISVARDYTSLEDVARRAGWKPMGYMGVLHMKNGITDVHELASKVQELAGDI
ncbi:MAG: ATPase, T2SS/T4P/T4SS family [Pseudomonadota bacterium]|nr:ATPase, T2SS/T4P/T4SS family [Pseudomonadota bacterium]